MADSPRFRRLVPDARFSRSWHHRSAVDGSSAGRSDFRPGLLAVLVIGLWLSVVVPVRSDQEASRELEAIDLGGLETRTAALLFSDQEGGELAMGLASVQIPRSLEIGTDLSSTSTVCILVELDGPQLLDPEVWKSKASDNRGLILELYAFAIDSDNRLAGSLTEAVRLLRASDMNRLRSGEMVFLSTLELAPGDYSLRVLVRHRSSDRMALRKLTLNVQDESKVQEALVVARSREPAIVVHSRGSAEVLASLRRDRTDDPGKPGDRTFFVPAVGALSRAEGELSEAWVIGRGRAAALVLLSADDPAERGLVVATLASVSPGSRIDGEAGSAISRRVELEPAKWGTDARELALFVDGTIQNRLAIEASGAEATGARAALVATGGRAAQRPGGGRYFEVLGAEYRRALEALALGDNNATAVFLAHHRARLMTSTSRGLEKTLGALERTIAYPAARCPTALSPVLLAWSDLYLEYHRAGNFLMSTVAKRHLLSAASVMTDDSGGGKIVAAVLVTLADYLREKGSAPASSDLIDLALDFAADHPAALMSKATLDEHFGRYREAVDSLRRLLEVRPQAAEAKLRLGVNLRRLGGRPEIGILLAEAAAAESWVGPVAAQELASHLASAGRVDEALSTLETARGRWPHNQRLYLLSASLLDRNGSHQRAGQTIERLEQVHGVVEGVSARFRYSRPPTAWGLEARAEIENAAAGDLPALALCLGVRDTSTRSAENNG